MINTFFQYKENKITIQCKSEEKLRNICQRFISKIGSDINSKIFIYDGRVINLESLLKDEIDLEKVEENEIVISVFDNIATINYNYEGRESKVIINPNEDFISKIFSKLKKKFGRAEILYNGNRISQEDYNKNFLQLSNKVDQNQNTMNILIQDFNEDDENNQENENQVNKNDEEKNTKNEKKKKNKNKIQNIQEDENEKIFFVRDLNKFLRSIYSYSILQFLCIGIFVFLGFELEFYKIFTGSQKVILWTFIVITIGASFLSGSFFDEDLELRISSIPKYSIIIYVPIIILYCFLLTIFIDNHNYIIGVLILFLVNFICNYFYSFFFNRYRGYIIFFINLIANTICMIILYYTLFSEPDKNTIIIISIIALIMILYASSFNFIAKRKFNDEEIVFAIMIFDYLFFFPVANIIGIVLLLGLIALILAIVILILALYPVFYLIYEFFLSLFC